jgi:hypothetical protein
MESINEDLSAAIAKVLATIPPAHLIDPVDNELYVSAEAEFDRLQDYAFSKGFCVVVESSTLTDAAKNKSLRLACIYHKIATRNTPKLDNEVGEGSNRTQQHTMTKAKDCQWYMFISYKRIR